MQNLENFLYQHCNFLKLQDLQFRNQEFQAIFHFQIKCQLLLVQIQTLDSSAWSDIRKIKELEWLLHFSASNAKKVSSGHQREELLANKTEPAFVSDLFVCEEFGIKSDQKMRKFLYELYSMAFPVLEFSRQGYKIRKVFG